MIAVSVERRGLGRPAHRYRLTPQGDETFPRAYDLLANALLDELRAWQGEAAVNELLERRRKRFFNTLQPYMKDKSLPERLRALADALDEQGFMAHVSELPAGQYRLEKRNCALHAVARKNPSLCCYGEAELYARLLSQVNVEREKTILDGHHACTFCICPGPSRAVLDSDLK
jgi:predicted ArsR family transcriptional regulator